MKKLIFFALTMCMCHSAYNQIYLHPLTDDELSSKGLKLYNDKKYIEAAPYLYAYYQNNYKAIKQSRSVTIEECLRFIEEDMKNANQERQSLPELKRELEKLRKRDDPSIGSSGDPLKHSAPKLILLTPNQEVKYNQHLEQVATETMPNEMTKKAKSRAGVTKADIETTPSTSSGGHGRNSEAKVSSETPISYGLILKGSETLEYSIISNTGSDHTEIVIVGFTKAAMGFNANRNIGQGEATWIDRPINTDEPNSITISVSNESFTTGNSNGRITFTGSLDFLNYLQIPTEMFRFQLYNNGQGSFMTTSPTRRISAKKQARN